MPSVTAIQGSQPRFADVLVGIIDTIETPSPAAHLLVRGGVGDVEEIVTLPVGQPFDLHGRGHLTVVSITAPAQSDGHAEVRFDFEPESESNR